MKGRKKQSIIIILIVGIMIILSSYNVSSISFNTPLNKSNDHTNKAPESHIINDVPYVSQETSFYCAYACYTMLLNSFEGINTTLQDVVYYSGVGYSLIYPSFLEARMPLAGTISSQSY